MVAGWPSGEGGLITPHWEHFPDSGDLGSTLRWEWPEGLDDALSLFLGSIDIFVLEESWPGQDWIVDAEIKSIEDIYHQIPPHRDLQFVFNCTGQVECECGQDGRELDAGRAEKGQTNGADERVAEFRA